MISYDNIELTEKTTYDFFTYNGSPLSTTLPYGAHYLRLTDGNSIWYSEWFSIRNIQPTVITQYISDTYDTFTDVGVNLTSAIKIAAAPAVGRTNSFTARIGEIFIFTRDLLLNSGEAPYARLSAGGLVRSNSPQMTVGLGYVELISTYSGTVNLDIYNSVASNFVLSSVSLRRKAGDYVHIEFTNARDFDNGDESIYYVGGFTQQAYLQAYENLPSHETIEIGPDKNGEFKAEKLVSKYTRSVISRDSRSMHNALRLLKLHSTVKILNEVGVEYTPAIGNVDVSIDWNTFDTGSLRIAWNEEGTVWTNSMDNIV